MVGLGEETHRFVERETIVRIIESNIPNDVKSFEYGKNHHYLRLQDGDGNETVMVEYGLIKYQCEKCRFIFFALTHQANHCARCGYSGLKPQWTRPQVALVPEQESDFKMSVKKDGE